jgi:hypothetical protein
MRLTVLSGSPVNGLAAHAAWTAPLLLLGCVQWQPIPSSQLSARPLPRWVQVTTTDSARFTLEHARVLAGDTLTGRSYSAADSEPLIRIPSGQIAHLEARVPSGPGSIGVAALVIGGVALFFFTLGHAADDTTR